MTTTDALPRWRIDDVYESMSARAFHEALERNASDVVRLTALFDEHGIRAVASRPVTADDGAAADAVVRALNAFEEHSNVTGAYLVALNRTDSFDETAQALLGEFDMARAPVRSLQARLADWVAALGVSELATVSTEVAEHEGPLSLLAHRAEHQMSEAEEALYAQLTGSGSSAWQQLHATVTSQLTTEVAMPDGSRPTLSMAAVRGLASHADPAVRRAAYDAEMAAWPTVATVSAAALNGVKGEAVTVNGRRGWSTPVDASLFANHVDRDTFDAMQQAVTESLPDFHGWLRTKARLHGHAGALPWSDLFAPLPVAPAEVTWDDGLQMVRQAFSSYGGTLAGLVDRAIDEQWIDAGPRVGKRGGAFCMSFTGDRSLVFLNWSGSVDSVQTTAHELGHAYHNTQLAHRTPMQKKLPMALAETASIFCETLMVEEGLQRLHGAERLALLDVDLQGSTQVVVDIRSRFLFEQQLFERRARRTLGVAELNEMMVHAQREAYGDAVLDETLHPYMWVVKQHYYGSHFYNWPYTYGLLFGLGLFAQYQLDPDRFRARYDDALSRAGIDTARRLGAAFGFDVSDVSFWRSSLDVVRQRMRAYGALAAEIA